MGYHLLAVFSGTTARPPAGLESPLAAPHKGRTYFDVDHEELERKVSETLEVRSPALPPAFIINSIHQWSQHDALVVLTL